MFIELTPISISRLLQDWYIVRGGGYENSHLNRRLYLPSSRHPRGVRCVCSVE